MNNDSANGMQDCPEDIGDWHLYHHLFSCTVAFGRGEASQLAFRVARRTVLGQLNIMANVICRACSGYGHRARDCPTNLRLGVIQSASVQNQKLIHWGRQEVETALVERSATLVELPSHHSVPMCIGKKRVHAMAFPGKK